MGKMDYLFDSSDAHTLGQYRAHLIGVLKSKE